MIRGMQNLGERIKYVRRLHKLSQERFGARLGVSRGAVANWERNEGISTENLIRIAEEFDVDFEWLARRGGQRPEVPVTDMGPGGPLRSRVTIASEAPALIPIRGRVAANTWLASDPLAMYDGQMRYLQVAADPATPVDATFAVVVGDQSVNDIAPEGASLICERIESADALAVGDFALIERTLEPGGMRELTVRRVHREAGRLVLRYASRMPELRDADPLELRQPSVRAVAVVLAAHIPLRQS